MSDTLNDNGVVGFTRRVTLSTSGVVILDDFKYDTANNAEFERTNEKSKTTGYACAKGIRKGTATAQLADATVNPSLYWGQTFTTTEGVETVNWVIIGTGRSESKSGETKASITFRETVGSVVLS
jgi:hypothetical protein